MIFTLIIAFIGLISLLVLHELGHFILAKKFGVKVTEFGLGYPPRIIGKKIGETIYSLNLLPFGAFVIMPGETEKSDDPRSFSSQPVLKRAIIAFGGVVSFWIMATVIFAIVSALGTPIAVEDEENSHLINPKVQIVSVVQGSPAKEAKLRVGDTILKIQNPKSETQTKVTTTKEVQEFIDENKGQEVILTIQRGEEIFEVPLMPRAYPPVGEGPMGIGLVRTAIKKYPWYLAPWEGISRTKNITAAVIQGYFQAIRNVVARLPSGIQLTGPVGVFQMLSQASQLGFIYYLNFLALISIYLAIFNILPIPAADGGKLLFLAIEVIRSKPIPEKIEQKITAFCFTLLIALMIFVTIKDIIRIF